MDYSFVRGQFVEDDLEKAIIELFENQGYTYVKGDWIHRLPSDILLLDDFREYISARYGNENLSDTEIQTIINKLNLINSTPLYQGNREAFRLINDGFVLVRDDLSKVALHIDYINYEEPDKNIFKVVNQYTVLDRSERRPDMLIFINGIPVAIFEFKSAIIEDTTVFNAWEQITKRYCRDIPKLMKYCFLSVISDGANNRMGSIFTPYEYYYAWNKANESDTVANGISSLFTMVEGAFAKDRIIALLRDFVFYPDESYKPKAVVCRYPQFFAAQKMLDNIRTHIRPVGDGKGGTYFGATGCGKTYTMLFLSRLITKRDNQTFNNPTIIILVDREDLGNQTAGLFANATDYLQQSDVRSIESREDLTKTLKGRPSGGIYITTIQKFCEGIGLLSDRNNIICISDEAHRSQAGVNPVSKPTENGYRTVYPFGYCLRKSFPNATYCGFTGTPVDETMMVFGDIVDSYTMKEACDDGITVGIAYEPRLARVIVSDEQAKAIQEYYEQCATEGSTPEQIEESKKAMSKIKAILGHPDRLHKLAVDIAKHYQTLCDQKPYVVQKAMIVCSDRQIAYDLMQEILSVRPDWGIPRRSEHEDTLSKEQLRVLLPLPKINLVATQGVNDNKPLHDACGNKEHRKMLDKQFKNVNSNFSIAIVVDMWITGFDVPPLAVMYIDKPLQKHTLIQTISRVNRVYEGKDQGLVVDYIGIKNDMMAALKKYSKRPEIPIDELTATNEIFRNHLKLVGDLVATFDASKFYTGSPLERLICLNKAAEYVQTSKDTQNRFMGLTLCLKSAYQICLPSGELTAEEIAKAQFYLAIRSIIYKQTKGTAPDTETMNSIVERMVSEAIACTGIENILDDKKQVDIFSEDFIEELKDIDMPITRFNALLRLLKRAIKDYGKTNKIKAIAFDERLKKIVEKYNTRDKVVFTNEVVSDFINGLSDELIHIFEDLKEDKASFERMGISFEEKAFYDILIRVRDDHKFPYEDEKCVVLAKKIKRLVDDKAQYADWSTRDDIKSQLNMDLTVLLYESGYPPEWDEEVFEKVMEQAENFKKYN